MADAAGRFSRRSNDNLLQLWKGRDALSDEDVSDLRDETERRGLSKEIEKLDDQVATRDIYGELPPPPQTYLNASVPLLWMRELWLCYQTKGGARLNATIESTRRTRSGRGFAARAELYYSYEFQGQQYRGKVVRDFSYDSAIADSLVYDHHSGEIIPVRISRGNPAISYFPSGLGIFDPFFLGFQSLFAWAIVVGLARLAILTLLHSK